MIIKRPLFLISGIIGVGYFIRRGLPALLRTLGLHAHYEGRSFDLSGKRALV